MLLEVLEKSFPLCTKATAKVTPEPLDANVMNTSVKDVKLDMKEKEKAGVPSPDV
jgi:hypothetical protein